MTCQNCNHSSKVSALVGPASSAVRVLTLCQEETFTALVADTANVNDWTQYVLTDETFEGGSVPTRGVRAPPGQ